MVHHNAWPGNACCSNVQQLAECLRYQYHKPLQQTMYATNTTSRYIRSRYGSHCLPAVNMWGEELPAVQPVCVTAAASYSKIDHSYPFCEQQTELQDTACMCLLSAFSGSRGVGTSGCPAADTMLITLSGVNTPSPTSVSQVTCSHTEHRQTCHHAAAQ